MTLAPVFRSSEAVKLLRRRGVWDQLACAVELQARGVQTVRTDLRCVIDTHFLDDHATPAGPDEPDEPENLAFIQDYFFLILFLSIFKSLGVPAQRLPFYAELDFCIMGTITAADNIFDDQAKQLLPLKTGQGARFASILQLMCFERLVRRAADRAIGAGLFSASTFDGAHKALLDQMARIGRLEGSEESGVDAILTPPEMIDQVHRVRGGLLFGLATVAPLLLEPDPLRERIKQAAQAIARLGTAFQIVDDLTDFEFDLGRRSHNLLVAQIHHQGTPEEQKTLRELLDGRDPEPGTVETRFACSARRVLQHARAEARASLQHLADLGFWFPVDATNDLVQAIVGLDGVDRMASLATHNRS